VPKASKVSRSAKQLAAGRIHTGVFPDGWGDEDTACADLIESLLLEKAHDLDIIMRRVKQSRSGSYYLDPASSIFPPKDLECALDLNRFDFAMIVSRENGRMIMKAEIP